MTIKRARRTDAPLLVNLIGVIGGANMVCPVPAFITPVGVSRHCSPLSTYHASGPGWICTLVYVPGGITARYATISYRLAFGNVSEVSGSGPILATNSPDFGAPSLGPKLNSQDRPSASATKLFSTFA